MGVPADQMGPVMEVLGQFAGEDELMTFDEFKSAYAALNSESGPENKKLKMQKRRFSMKK